MPKCYWLLKEHVCGSSTVRLSFLFHILVNLCDTYIEIELVYYNYVVAIVCGTQEYFIGSVLAICYQIQLL